MNINRSLKVENAYPSICNKTVFPSTADTDAESARVETEVSQLNLDDTKAEFSELDKVLTVLSEKVIATLEQMIPHLSAMQALLSQRGKVRKSLLAKAGLPSWTEYANTYARKLNCSMRTIQDHLTGFRRTGRGGPSRQAGGGSASTPIRLDAREQATLVKAQLAVNELIAALRSGGDWQSAVLEYEKVSVTTGKLDTFVNTLNSEPEWKGILFELLTLLEESGDRLPLAVLTKKRAIEALLKASGDQGHLYNVHPRATDVQDDRVLLETEYELWPQEMEQHQGVHVDGNTEQVEGGDLVRNTPEDSRLATVSPLGARNPLCTAVLDDVVIAA